MTATWVPKVAKLLPLLGSNVDGEVVAAARAIARALKAEGADLHDMVHALTRQALPNGGPGPSPHRNPFNESTSRRSADDIFNAAQRPFTTEELKRQASAYAERQKATEENRSPRSPDDWLILACQALMVRNLTPEEFKFLGKQLEKARQRGQIDPISRGMVQGMLDRYGVTL